MSSGSGGRVESYGSVWRPDLGRFYNWHFAVLVSAVHLFQRHKPNLIRDGDRGSSSDQQKAYSPELTVSISAGGCLLSDSCASNLRNNVRIKKERWTGRSLKWWQQCRLLCLQNDDFSQAMRWIISLFTVVYPCFLNENNALQNILVSSNSHDDSDCCNS